MFARIRSRLMLLALVAPTVALLAPGGALALGLGDIHLKSTLDAPLSADIDVVDASADDLASLKATLASRETFMQLGADYPAFLGTVTFTVEHTADGRSVLHVTSSGIANEPLATLLVEADWARGHVVREYTLLLNPPTFTSATPSNSPVAAPQVDNGTRAGSIQQPAATGAASAASEESAPSAAAGAGAAAAAGSEPSGAPANAAAPAAAQGNEAQGGQPQGVHGGSTYTVQRGDTLSSIAAQAYPGGGQSARDRALVAIYRDNPRAFAGRNMNMLLAGSSLRLPGDEELVAIGPGEASAEVRQQYDAWRNNHGGAAVTASGTPQGAAAGNESGQLRLVAPQEATQEASTQSAPGAGSGNGAVGAATGGSRAALQQRVQQLQAQLTQSQRLLQLRDAQLAAMQARLQQQGKSAAAATPSAAAEGAESSRAPEAPAQAATPPPAVPPPAGTQSVTAPPAAPATAAAGANAPGAAATNAKRPVLARPRVVAHGRAAGGQGNSLLDLLLQYWYVPAGLVAVLIALLALRAVRSRQGGGFDSSFDHSLGELPTPTTEPSPGPAAKARDTMPVRALAGREEPAYRVEESGTHARPRFDEAVGEEGGGAAAAQATGQHVAIDEGMTGEVPVALDQGDPLAEADFHMAYGLYDQAAELVQGAIAREPQRRDLKLKLLEVFFVWGNKERFLQSAHELAGTREQAPPGEWEKIVIMGRQIAPEDALFADQRGLAGAASGGIDLNLEGGQNRVDFDLLGEPSLGAAAQDAVDLDLGTALGQAATGTHGPVGTLDPTSEALGLNSSVDFVLDGSEATGSTRKMPGAAAAAASASAITREMPAAITREMPAMPADERGLGDTERVAIGASAEAPTVEQPQLHDDSHSTIRQKLDAASRHGLLASEQTAEIAIDDLGLDLDALETHGDSSDGEPGIGADAPTMLARMDEETHRVLVRAEEHDAADAAQGSARGAAAGAGDSADTQASRTTRATQTWLFTDTDFAQMAPVKGPSQADATQRARTELITQIAVPPQIDTSSTSRLAALDSSRLDLDLSALGGPSEGQTNGVDLDVGTPGGDATLTARRPAMQGDSGAGADEGLPDLEPVTLSEVGTKLDLARAYMDMGDPEGARSILSEVLSEGSLSQKQEARRLMDALPG